LSDLKEQLLAEITTESGLTLKEQNFLNILFEGCQGDIRMAMNESGFSKDIPVAVMARKFAKEIKEMAKDYLISSAAKASVKLVSVIDDPNQIGAKNVIAATNSVLDRAGVFKEEAPQVSEVRNVFILPAKAIEDSVKVIDHE
jgi:hypothetical protein